MRTVAVKLSKFGFPVMLVALVLVLLHAYRFDTNNVLAVVGWFLFSFGILLMTNRWVRKERNE